MELSVDYSLPGRIFKVDYIYIYIYIYWCILNLIKSQDHTSGVTFHFNFFLLSIKYKLLKIHELNKSIPIIFKNKHRNNLSMRPVLSFCQIINLTASEFLQSLLNLHASFFYQQLACFIFPTNKKKQLHAFCAYVNKIIIQKKKKNRGFHRFERFGYVPILVINIQRYFTK